MKCPFSGKPCLLPKEVLVTEYKSNDVAHNLFLCKDCGDDYIQKLNDNEKVTKKVDVLSANPEGITRTEHIIGEESQLIDAPTPKKPALLPQIKKVEAKMQEASDKEDYEEAAKLRDILKLLKEELSEEKKKDIKEE